MLPAQKRRSDEAPPPKPARKRYHAIGAPQTGSNDMFAHLPYVENLGLGRIAQKRVACVAARTETSESGSSKSPNTHACRARGHAVDISVPLSALTVQKRHLSTAPVRSSTTRLVRARGHAVFCSRCSDRDRCTRCRLRWYTSRRWGKPPGTAHLRNACTAKEPLAKKPSGIRPSRLQKTYERHARKQIVLILTRQATGAAADALVVSITIPYRAIAYAPTFLISTGTSHTMPTPVERRLRAAMSHTLAP